MIRPCSRYSYFLHYWSRIVNTSTSVVQKEIYFFLHYTNKCKYLFCDTFGTSQHLYTLYCLKFQESLQCMMKSAGLQDEVIACLDNVWWGTLRSAITSCCSTKVDGVHAAPRRTKNSIVWMAMFLSSSNGGASREKYVDCVPNAWLKK